MKAIWRGQVLAESDDTVVVEDNHYFPADSLVRPLFQHSDTTSVCPWKGTASYYHVEVEGELNRDAAWYYSNTRPAAAEIEGWVALWHGIEVLAS